MGRVVDQVDLHYRCCGERVGLGIKNKYIWTSYIDPSKMYLYRTPPPATVGETRSQSRAKVEMAFFSILFFHGLNFTFLPSLSFPDRTLFPLFFSERLRKGERVLSSVSLIIYRVAHLLVNLGWVDLDLGSSLGSGLLV